MKYSTNSSDNLNTLFCDQVQQMTNFYDQWNDCERTVVISALFKRLPMANLKFLLHSIDHYLKTSLTTPQQLGIFEEAANAVSFLNKLVHKYNTISNFKSSNDNIDCDQECIGNDNNVKSLENDIVSKYTSKEEIVQDLLTYLPLLRPNNDEAKKVYIQFLSVIAEDSMKHYLPMELVQQILSYLLIHPALKNEERKPLHQWSNKLQEHISMSISTTNSIGSGSNFVNVLSSDNISSFMSNTSSMSSASSSSSASSTTWPTAVPQAQIQTSQNDMLKSKREQEFWDLRNFQITHDLCDDLNQQMNKQTKYSIPIGNNSGSSSCNSHSNINNNNNNNGSNNNTSQNNNDEHHISFSKNGTDVDFDNDIMDSVQQKSTTSLTTISAPINITNEFLTVPNFFSDHIYDVFGYGSGGGSVLSDGFSDDGSMIKTRRSNSLTTPSASGDFLMSSSAENLANLQKPRSYSLTMETSRTLTGSETRLDKLAQLRLDNNYSLQVGMGNIAIWLKSLRLHKYLWLFTNMSYDQMMDMTEEYLESLGVTKGARHKLVLCIQKLADRVIQLKQIEKELTDGTRSLKSGLDEITNIVLSPMKPINSVPCDEDVATHVMRILDCAFKIVQGVKYFSSADEESVNAFLWVLDKTLHHDAFQQQVPHLKDYKFKLQRIKIMFGNKFNGGNNNNSNNNINSNSSTSINSGNNLNKGNKPRWNKSKLSNQGSADNQKHRKNSMPPYYLQSYSQNQNVSNSKSLSFPNFGNVQATNLSNFQRSASREKLNQFTLMQQQHHIQFNQQINSQNNNNTSAYQLHNSLNNLMPFGVHQLQQQNQLANRRNSSCGTDRANSSLNTPMIVNKSSSSEKLMSESSMNTNFNMLTTPKGLTPTTSDINSRLESLCRQMTEQAIN